ncbi:methyl-accepting chemotaxis protein [Tumebacillus sp. DT12]|uniref:Methyl-accepting chemotaxis protein n=1 Tax=Tumebacillus lacus TaxID=2995335 RepID=A0ABT3WYM7_9BACL|nr:methyl-accepting chemotaxis protein [Tumebacillus lacus]MCX7569760.1 methyl-accepting chemotaxis protein [Tumebacillus lacus]
MRSEKNTLSFGAYLLRTVLMAVLAAVLLSGSTVWINDLQGMQVVYTVAVTVVLSGLTGAAITTVNFRRFLQPMNMVIEHVTEMSQGNLSIRLDEEMARGLKPLAVSVNEMSANWEQLIGEVNHTALEVNALSQELAASAEETRQATQQVTVLIQEIAEGADLQASHTLESAQAFHEVAAGMGQISDRSTQVTAASQRMAAEAAEGNRTIRQVMGQMESIAGAVDRLSAVVRHLDGRSQEIGKILEVITGIAGQTNLLALNAAIEAARAGEQGRGFAVVADEVRKLAEQSGESARQIEDMITEILEDTAQAVLVMGEGVTEVRAGSELAQQAGAAFERIVLAADNIAEQNGEVTQVTQAITVNSQQVSAGVSDMTRLAEQSASYSQDVAASSEEQLASMEQIQQTAHSLSDLAQQLQRLIDRLHVK